MEAFIITKKEFESFLKTLEEIKEAISKSENKNFENEWFDNQNVCDTLKISKRTLQNYRDKGILSFSQVGNKIYYKASDIQEHLEANYINYRSSKI